MSFNDTISTDIVVPKSHGPRNYQLFKKRNNGGIKRSYQKYIAGIFLVSSLSYYSLSTSSSSSSPVFVILGVVSSFQLPNQPPLHHYRQQAPYGDAGATNRRGWERQLFLQKDGSTTIVTTKDDITLPTHLNKQRGRRRKKNQDVLTIGARISYTSDPKPAPASDTKALAHFFRRYHGMLLRGGYDDGDEGAYPIERLSFDKGDCSRNRRLLRKWKEQCVNVDAKAPNLDDNGGGGGCDYMASVETEGISMGGIRMAPTSVIGVKILPSVVETDGDDWKEGSMMPEFQGVLIKNVLRAKGPRLGVWLFNTILYGNKNPDYDADDKMMETSSLTRVWTEFNDDDEQQLVFRATSFMQINIFYPKTLSRLLPLGKNSVERLCSKLIAKALEKTLFPAMKRFHGVYQEWIIPDIVED